MVSVIPAMILGGDHVRDTTRRGEHARPKREKNKYLSVFIRGYYF